MPLITCPDCSKEISDAAPTCPHCGRPNKSIGSIQTTAKSGSGCGAIAVFLIVSFIIATVFIGNSIINTPTVKFTTDAMTPDETATVDAILKEGLAEIEPVNHEVFVDPLLWNAADAKKKELLTRLFSIRMGTKHGTDWTFVKMVDKQSGKVLAEFSSISGYTVK